MNVRESGVSKKLSTLILQDILSGRTPLGCRLNAKNIAEEYNVSRTPVRDALMELEQHNIVNRVPNKGFFVADELPDAVQNRANELISNTKDDYQLFVDDWLTNSIPDTVTELFIRERYKWTKSKALAVLNRATREGWAEQNPGYGWKLLPVAKSSESFTELYRFRATIESAALLEPTFKLDKRVIKELREIQHHLLDSELNSIPNEVILEYGAKFHEELIKMSGNPYFLMALQRLNQMRKLLEYKARVDRERVLANCSEHLEILDLIEQGALVDASMLLRKHLNNALDRKIKNI